MYDIAAALGISQTTVSLVLSARHGSVGISEATRQQVLETAEKLNYRPNLNARSLSTRRTQLIAVWTKRLSASYCAAVLEHLETLLSAAGFGMLVCAVPNEPKSDWSDVPAAQWPVDGILAHETAWHALTFASTFPNSCPPIVTFGGDSFEFSGLDSVGVDWQSGAKQAFDHLLETGRQHIAYVIDAGSAVPGNPRFDAYLSAMKNAHRPCEIITLPRHDQSRETAWRTVKDHLASENRPDALFCHNDDIALGAYRAICEAGLRVPTDIALVGCDGIPETLYLEKPLSTIVSPRQEMCQSAWELLVRRQNGLEAPETHLLLPAHLEIRASSAPST